MSAHAEYTIGEVASMIGFSPHTIRAWERRHKILKPHRTPSGQRRYSVEDVELLREVINGVVVRGLTLKVAVRVLLSLGVSATNVILIGWTHLLRTRLVIRRSNDFVCTAVW